MARLVGVAANIGVGVVLLVDIDAVGLHVCSIVVDIVVSIVEDSVGPIVVVVLAFAELKLLGVVVEV